MTTLPVPDARVRIVSSRLPAGIRSRARGLSTTLLVLQLALLPLLMSTHGALGSLVWMLSTLPALAALSRLRHSAQLYEPRTTTRHDSQCVAAMEALTRIRARHLSPTSTVVDHLDPQLVALDELVTEMIETPSLDHARDCAAAVIALDDAEAAAAAAAAAASQILGSSVSSTASPAHRLVAQATAELTSRTHGYEVLNGARSLPAATEA